jgi:hypothetical protein
MGEDYARNRKNGRIQENEDEEVGGGGGEGWLLRSSFVTRIPADVDLSRP